MKINFKKETGALVLLARGVRLFLAFIFVVYSTSKFLGGQFITEGPTLDTRISELSGLELTWAYFGSSSLYSFFLASSQWLGGVLLLYWRTVRLALIILIPMMANIVVVNFAFEITPGTKIASVLYLILLLGLAGLEWNAWWRFFWPTAAVGGSLESETGKRWIARGAIAVAVIGIPLVGLTLIANSYFAKTPLVGNWRIVEVQSDSFAEPRFEKLYFQKSNQFSAGVGRFIYPGDYSVKDDQVQFQIQYWPSPDELRWRMRLLPDSGLTAGNMAQRQRDEKRSIRFQGTFRFVDDGRVELTGSSDNQPCTLILNRD